jgi:RNA polymerase sigma-70 factor (ECF subfamily)
MEVSAERASLRLVRPDASGGEPEPLDLDSVFRNYARYVGAIAYRLLGRDEEVDDVVQEVFVDVVVGLGRLEDPGALKAWLRTITIRVVAKKLRARRMRRFFGLDRGVDYESMPGTLVDPETKALFSRVYRALDGVPTGERLAWTLRHVEGQSLEEVAAQCGVSLATAKRRIAAASDALAKELGPHG